ncbi:MltA domain-containing protein [Jannaschia sp. W003]|uniref:MltA domain-containing protein n=1 Tax=Jannaschia sp. W003 TaxID=2867012 RepID=UPI0021A77591|nr:MltA domain-containing protein [Jannaschia sp. W003]UWQ21981.1 MltA domain-containing protein [Jannaschia sp. W003]
MRGAAELRWSDLRGWEADDHGAALRALSMAPGLEMPEGDPRRFFEERFTPWLLPAAQFTGYFEPELDGAAECSDTFPVPVHAPPPMGIGAPRAQIEAEDLLRGQEIAWLRDEVDRFFLQVQGSGRIRLADGGVLRVTHAAKNGHPYRSIGRILVERGVFAPDAITADALLDWLREDRARGVALMRENPSYVMFRALHDAGDGGPPGTLCPVTAGRSIAVDANVIPLGLPVWIECDAPPAAGGPIRRLVAAQDTGSAIVGVGRADLFFGTGEEAGRMAGALNHGGRMVVLQPR